jgi:hypothetical protein
MKEKLLDQVYIAANDKLLGYNIVAYTDNLDTEIIVSCILDICQWMNNHFNGKKIMYQFDYPGGQSHYVLGVWQNGRMENIEKDYIYTSL